MTWKPTDHIDEEVRSWMKGKGWDVTATDYHFDQEIYSGGTSSPEGNHRRYALRGMCWNTIQHSSSCITLTGLRWPRQSAVSPA
jgi:hypothetical protein